MQAVADIHGSETFLDRGAGTPAQPAPQPREVLHATGVHWWYTDMCVMAGKREAA
jgi:hypothetical protein